MIGPTVKYIVVREPGKDPGPESRADTAEFTVLFPSKIDEENGQSDTVGTM